MTCAKTWKTRRPETCSILPSVVHSRTGFRPLLTFWFATGAMESVSCLLKQKQMQTLWFYLTRSSRTLKSCMETLLKTNVKWPWRDSRRASSEYFVLLMSLPEVWTFQMSTWSFKSSHPKKQRPTFIDLVEQLVQEPQALASRSIRTRLSTSSRISNAKLESNSKELESLRPKMLSVLPRTAY